MKMLSFQLSATWTSFPSSCKVQSAKTLNPFNDGTRKRIGVITSARDRGKNRKQLQRGRNLSIEAIQTVQSLKRAAHHNLNNNTGDDDTELKLQRVFESKFKRLLKLDMIAVLRELIRQNQPLLALMVFEDVRKEYWYKPQVLIYADMIKMLASNNLFESIEPLLFYLKTETYYIDADTESFNAIFEILMDNGFTSQAMEQFQLMQEIQYELNESIFKILVKGLESKGETHLSSMLRQEAGRYFGRPLEFVEGEMDLSCN